MSVRSSRMSRASERGFSLIELGIVIAVIAVLASVVIVGRGFINSSRTGKAAEALSTIRKAGAVYTSNMTVQSPSSEIDALQRRDLLPRTAADPQGANATWTMTGSGTTAFKVTSVMFGQIGNGWGVFITVVTPEITMAEDLVKLVSADPNFKDGGQVANQNCQSIAAKVTTQNINLCFKL